MGHIQSFVKIIAVAVVRDSKPPWLKTNVLDRLDDPVGLGVDNGNRIRTGVSAIKLRPVWRQNQAVRFRPDSDVLYHIRETDKLSTSPEMDKPHHRNGSAARVRHVRRLASRQHSYAARFQADTRAEMTIVIFLYVEYRHTVVIGVDDQQRLSIRREREWLG